jgi:predicted acetyltransferase
MKLEVGPVPEERRDEWWAIQEDVFAFEFKENDKELFTAVQDWDRVWGAYDGDTMVGSAASLTFSMTVPGGTDVPTAGLTAVSVLPTHRRSGALTSMMRASFQDARDRGDPLAALLASENAIYGRFGYGAGSHETDLVVERDHAALRAGPPATGRVRFMDVEEARQIVPDLQRSCTSGSGIPGSIARTDPMWELYFHDPEHWRNGATKRKWAVYENGDGEARGYVRYRVKEKWERSLPQYTLIVISLHAIDAEAYSALYTYCFGIDLVSEIKLYSRRVGEPIFELLADPRQVKRSMRDGLWVRLVDVPRALAARRYRVEDRLVIEVQDSFCPWNEGRFALEGGPDGAECVPTEDEPDLRIGASDLASAYLGDGRLAAQAWAGRVKGTEEAIQRASLMLSWGQEAWNTVDF